MATPPPEASPGTVTPELAALAVDRVNTYAPQLLEQTGVPGMAVAVVYGGQVLFVGGFGTREVGSRRRVDGNTVFQLASVSKSIAATVVSAVVGDGVISWQSRLAEIAPGLALADAWPTENVTLADLFAHRSGLPDHAGDILEDLGYSRSDILASLRYLTPEYSFRAGYAYTNFGLTAAAEAVAQAVGVPWEELSAERIYRPLGMAHTSSRFADYMAQANRAIPHVRDGDAWVVTPEQRDPDAQTPAGGVCSTARDLAEWLKLQLGQGTIDGRELIPAAALAPMHRPQSVSHVPADPATERAGFYGLGVNVSYTEFGTVQWSHSGAFALGAATAYYLLPGSGFGVLALTNGSPIGVPEAFCLDILDIAQVGEISRDWMAIAGPAFAAMAEPEYGTGTDWETTPEGATAALPAAAYSGTYSNDLYGEVVITQAGDGLALQIGPEPREFPLAHYDRDTFSWQPTGENATVRSGLTFIVGPDGEAVGFADEYLASGGDGELARSTD